MQIETSAMSAIVEWLLKGGNVGVLLFVGVIGVKVNDRLKRDETLHKDYPPHRHVGMNGSSAIVYPEDYQPAKIEKLGA